MKQVVLLILLTLQVQFAWGQRQTTYAIKGVIINSVTRKPIYNAGIIIWGTTQGAASDSVGNFSINNVKPGTYRLQAFFIGYKPFVSAEFSVTNKNQYIPLSLEETAQKIPEISITASPLRKTVETPLGIQVIGLKEIEKSAGANRDISRVIQSFPGVSSAPTYRNDLMVRGGGPSENRFFLDGVEIPNINHFSTQGASGGPVGIINPDLVREINFYTAAFPASRGNALSSVLDFKLRDGNPDKVGLKAVVGASELAAAVDGPLGKKTTWHLSVRRSYLQLLFDLIGLPFLPTFTDAQFKIKTRFNSKNVLTILGLGAIDDMKLNTDMEDPSDENQYILDYLPVIKQKSYTLGAVYKHFAGNNIHTFVLSRNYLNNKNIKYKDNEESEDNLMLRYGSSEIENRFRNENVFRFQSFILNVGANLDYAQYDNDTYQRIFTQSPQLFTYQTDLNLWKYGAFASAQYESSNELFSGSVGVRVDGSNYSSEMSNPFEQFSPRISGSIRITPKLYLNAHVGRYYQLPSYTTLGFKDSTGSYINRINKIRYIKSNQMSAGVEYRLFSHLKLSAEGFYKQYKQYPISLLDSIPLASKGADYGVVGNEAIASTGQGRAYGTEAMARWYNHMGLSFIASYTYVRSEFKDIRNSEKYIPSAWDNRHLLTISSSYALPKNWDIGAKFRFVGGAPYTPFDLETGSLVDVWDTQGKLLYNYDEFNSKRLGGFTQLDLRLDKTFYFKKVTLGLYIDVQNVLNSKYKSPDLYIRTGKTINSPEGMRYELRAFSNESGTILPSIGIMVEI
jgi:outer membrane receptor for ferrienterochelin and colicin